MNIYIAKEHQATDRHVRRRDALVTLHNGGVIDLALPTAYRRGHPWKVAVMAARYEKGLPITVAGDSEVAADCATGGLHYR